MYEVIRHLRKLKEDIYAFYKAKRDKNDQLLQEEMSYNEFLQIKNDLDKVFGPVEETYRFFKRIMLAYKKLESDHFGTISYVIYEFGKIQKELQDLPQKYHIGVTQFNAMYKEYWEENFERIKLTLFIATRLNPLIKHELILTPDEIKTADDEILKIMNRINPPTNERRAAAANSDSNSSELSDAEPIEEELSNSAAFNYYISNRCTFEKKQSLWSLWMKLSKQSHYSVLFKVAMKILSTIITSASAERLFSASARNTSYLRMRLSKDHVRHLALISGNKEMAIHEMEVNPIKELK